MKTNKKRQREHSFSEEIIHSSNLNLDLTEKISNAKQAKNLQKLFKDKCLIDILPTHEAELTPVTDFKLTYQIRQVIKTKSIINCNTLISLVNFI